MKPDPASIENPHRDPPLWESWWFRFARRIVLLGLLLAGLFSLLEFLAWRRYPQRSTRYLISGLSQGQPAWVDNQFFSYRFFSPRIAQAALPVAARKNPPPGTLRVCLLGGSETAGMPTPAFGLGPVLEQLLRQRYPGRPVEVIPLAMEGANSHVLREAARDLARLRPQAVIVLTGNEEVAGPYGPVSGVGRFYYSLRLARAMTLFSRTRLSQWIIATGQRLMPARTELQAWQRREPHTLKGRISPTDPRLKVVVTSFRRNLAAILKTARAAAPVVIVSTVPVNLRDCAPFSTHYLEDETAAQEVRELLRQAQVAETATNRLEAARLYAEILRRHSTHAEVLYRAGRLALKEQQSAEAADLFARARDADALRLRADSAINAAIRACAAESGVSLFDAENLFAIRSPNGIPGREWFLDHIHFTFDGTYLLASALIDRLESLRAFDPPPGAPLPPSEILASEMLFHPWGRATQLKMVIQQMLLAPFRRQLDNSETLSRLKAQLRVWEKRAAALPPDQARAEFARRLTATPDQPGRAALIANHLLRLADPVSAESAAAVAFEFWPHRFDIRALLALCRVLQGGEIEEALALLRGGEHTDAGYYDVAQALVIGRRLQEMNKADLARPWLEYACQRDPWNSDAARELAQTLYRLDDGQQALQVLQTAIEHNPRHPLLWEDLASLYCLIGDWQMANKCFRKSEEIAPYRYERLLKWADALIRLKQFARASRPLRQYLAIYPDDPEAVVLQAHIQKYVPLQEEVPAETEEKPSRRFPWE